MKQLERRTWAEISLPDLEHNYRALRAMLAPGCRFLGVVKANAYGHGAVRVAQKLEQLGAEYLAVACLGEAVELREAGIRAPILILGYTPADCGGELLRYGLTQTIYDAGTARAFSEAACRAGKRLRVHVKADTGMSRLGWLCGGAALERAADDIQAVCALPGLEAEGIYTHFANADSDEDYTMEQFTRFLDLLAELERRGVTFQIRHCAASAAVLKYPCTHLDMVRPGIALYGVGADAQRLDLRPVMSLKSSVSTIKTFDPGTDVSYGRTFRTQGRTRIGVLPIGYADGFFRGLSNRMSVVTAQGPAPQRGRICMDMSMIDLTGLPDVKVGDEVEIFGCRQRVDDLAAILNTIPYELTCAVSKRVPRVYIEGGKIVERSLRLL